MKKPDKDPAILVPVWAANPALLSAALTLADSLGVALLEELDEREEAAYLALTEQRLELRSGDKFSDGPVFAEFISGKMGYRRAQGLGRRQPLGRAVGLKKGEFPTVLDATPGLGRDGFVLACLGCSVRWVERSVIVAALLQDGLNRACTDPASKQIIEQNISLEVGDAQDIMLAGLEPEEVVYLDPMYPHRTKSALVKKEMRRLRLVVGGDEDSDSLLDRALRYAKNRVVVKRPHPSKPLGNRVPDFAIPGKKTRFDVYLTKN
jgi:16S rRNA (guanine1516-N2)-methyltransferase